MDEEGVTILLNSKLKQALEALLETGMYGTTIEGVAERLIAVAIQAHLQNGMLALCSHGNYVIHPRLSVEFEEE